MKAALLLVDLQNDFMPGGALGVKDGDQILPVINKLLNQEWDLVVASKDWHPDKHSSFESTWPVHCVQDTPGAEFCSGWDSEKVQEVIFKGTNKAVDSYSIFFDNNHEHPTGLDEILKKHEITSLTIAGLATDYCVKFSVLDAIALGYEVTVVEDGCQAVNLDAEDGIKALKEMFDAGAIID